MRPFLYYVVMCIFMMGFTYPYIYKKNDRTNVSTIKAPPLVDTFRKQLATVQLYTHYKNGCPAYRIQVINTNKKSEAVRIVNDLSLIAPQVPVHFTYREPYYRVRVGAFRTELDAEPLRKKIDLYYSQKYIVLTLPEVISLQEAIDVFIKQEENKKNYNDFLIPLPLDVETPIAIPTY